MTERFVFEKYKKSEEKSPQDITLSEIQSWRSGYPLKKVKRKSHSSSLKDKRNAFPYMIEESTLHDLRTSVSINKREKPFLTKKRTPSDNTKSQSIQTEKKKIRTTYQPAQPKTRVKSTKRVSKKSKPEIQVFFEQFSFVQNAEEFISNNRIPFLIVTSLVQFIILFLILIFSFNQHSRGSFFNTKFLTITSENQLVSNKEYKNSWKFNVNDLVIVKKIPESDLTSGDYIALYTDESKGDFLIRELNIDSSKKSDNELIMQPENGEERLLTVSKEAYIGKVTGQYKKLGALVQTIMQFKIIIIIFTTLIYCLMIYITIDWIK